MIRPEFLALLRRFSEVIWATAVLGFGLWLILLGGYLLTPVGTAIGAFGVAWGILALRRLRFIQTVDAPGVVEVDEGQIGYLGPQSGGYVSIPELVELRLLSLRGRRVWRLKQADGQALLIPVDATGADRLFDAFASLPGMNTLALVAALDAKPSTGASHLALAAETTTIWHRTAQGALARE
ncbi:MAG: hypothetical protein U1A24_09545 [Cypionkella sp.]|uniref:hypothetical protein n=1 Tax=Cypionkella sp. TaxID=2811411 RepID=UPI002ABA6A7B|nr:hypothetical protein [Cypionkella sp.]MDZ4310782.1 hypothetical protein [Cypionkella sp.]MDZ4395636.1 hypothetical protein [Cypionkella sp.]